MMQKDRKVFVVNKGGHDYTAAGQYGELIFLSEGNVDRLAISHMYRLMAEHINDSSPEDYILLCGLPSMQAIACSMFAFKHKRLNLLLFWNGEYQERTIVLNNLLTQT